MSARAILIAMAICALPLQGAHASPLEDALSNGGVQLTADEIADTIVGKTVGASLGEKRFLFYYSPDNVLTGQLVGGGWSDAGYYGITDDNRVCLSMTKDNGRLRCLTLVRQEGRLRKYNSVGEATFELLNFNDGKTF